MCAHTDQSTLQSLPSAPAAQGVLAFWFFRSCVSKPSKTSRKGFKLALRTQIIDSKLKFWLVGGTAHLEGAQQPLPAPHCQEWAQHLHGVLRKQLLPGRRLPRLSTRPPATAAESWAGWWESKGLA